MGWKPSGLLREAVEVKKLHIELMEQTLTERPDHPINIRRSFFSQRTSHRFSKSLRRRDGTIAVVASMKRIQPPPPGGKAEKIAELEDIARETRALDCSGVDAALIETDTMNYGIMDGEIAKIAKHLQVSNVELGMPLARQDLILSPIQIAEAAEDGACAISIVAAAALDELMELMNAATAMGLEAIVECHTTLERDFAMECGATILHLTNWDRTRNKLVPGTAEKLVEGVPPFVLTMGGGGLVTAGDCWQLLDAGFNAAVLGKALLQSRRQLGLIKEIRTKKRITGDVFAGGMGTPFSGDVDDV